MKVTSLKWGHWVNKDPNRIITMHGDHGNKIPFYQEDITRPLGAEYIDLGYVKVRSRSLSERWDTRGKDLMSLDHLSVSLVL